MLLAELLMNNVWVWDTGLRMTQQYNNVVAHCLCAFAAVHKCSAIYIY